MLTGLNIAARIRAGRPLLSMMEELIYYKCKAEKPYRFYEDELLVLFQAWAEELVWQWREYDVTDWIRAAGQNATMKTWETEVALPCLEVHEKLSLQNAPLEELRDAVKEKLRILMPSALKNLHC